MIIKADNLIIDIFPLSLQHIIAASSRTCPWLAKLLSLMMFSALRLSRGLASARVGRLYSITAPKSTTPLIVPSTSKIVSSLRCKKPLSFRSFTTSLRHRVSNETETAPQWISSYDDESKNSSTLEETNDDTLKGSDEVWDRAFVWCLLTCFITVSCSLSHLFSFTSSSSSSSSSSFFFFSLSHWLIHSLSP